jgi:tetratricopeptide (TPR) repeat protein
LDPIDRVLYQAEEYLTGERWADLERAAARLLVLDPVAPEAHYYRAKVSYFAGRLSEALADCTRAIELDPEWGLAYLARSRIHEAIRDVSKAKADYDKAIEFDSGLGAEKPGRVDED